VYLGLLNFYRLFVNKLAEKIVFLKNEIGTWYDKKEKIFLEIKASLELTIHLVDYSGGEIFIHSDALDQAIAGHIFQMLGNEKRNLGFFSRTLDKTERKLSIPVKELLAGVAAMEHFRFIIVGIEFKWLTDAKSIATILDDEVVKSRSRLINSLFFEMQEFNFTTRHISREQNVVADLLSNLYELDSKSLNELKEDWEKKKISDQDLVLEMHKNFHFSPAKLVKFLNNELGIQIQGMFKMAKDASAKCKHCLKFNLIAPKYWGLQKYVGKKPFQCWQLDLFEPGIKTHRGMRYVMLIIDELTGFSILKSIKKKEMGVCLMVILEVITFTGIPNEIKADEAFKGELFKEFENLTKTKLRISYPYNHHSNAKVERANKDARISVLKEAMELFDNKKDWDLALPFANYKLNLNCSKELKCSKFQLATGRPFFSKSGNNDEMDFEELKNHWKEFHGNTIRRLNNFNQVTHDFNRQKKNTMNLEIGQKVYKRINVDGNKSQKKFKGAYIVKGFNLEKHLVVIANEDSVIEVPMNFIKKCSSDIPLCSDQSDEEIDDEEMEDVGDVDFESDQNDAISQGEESQGEEEVEPRIPKRNRRTTRRLIEEK
jgi:hypothetical protein